MIYALKETKTLLDKIPRKERSRGLLACRFSEIKEGKEDKKYRSNFSENLKNGAVFSFKASHQVQWLKKNSTSFFSMKLQSRMMINMSGGVIENGNLCLDRYGIPYIPGSAVKGCARRQAIYLLKEESDFEKKKNILRSIAQVFGWGDSDWKTCNEQSNDFQYACGEHWEDIRNALKSETWGKSENFAGSVCFHEAYPDQDPGIELDIVTPHHKEYYESEGPNAKAWDTEKPSPNIFPAVKSGGLYYFGLSERRKSSESSLIDTAEWLRAGLETWGVGAKTSSGYGWFAKETNEEATVRKDKVEADIKEKEKAELRATDFPTDAHFKNLVLIPLEKKQPENIIKGFNLLKKLENKIHVEKLKPHLKGSEFKNLRKWLKEKMIDYPESWIQ